MVRILAGFMLLGMLSAPLYAVGFHWGEVKDLQVEIEYFNYAYKTADGEPVYYIGSPLTYRITLKNQGNRTFNNFEAKSTLVWVEDAQCVRWWYDGTSAEYFAGDPLPGDSSSGLRNMYMRKGGNASYDEVYNLPMSLCPGRGDIWVEGRHRNQSGRDDTASFRIPLNFKLERRK